MRFGRVDMAQLLGSFISAVGDRTGVPCYDSPVNKPSPLYSVEIEGTEPKDNKTMRVEAVTLLVHCIAQPTGTQSKAGALALARDLEEAMTGTPPECGGTALTKLSYRGIVTVKTDPSGEGHVVTRWVLEIAYELRNEVS